MRIVDNINAYLVSAPNVFVKQRSKPNTQQGVMSFGNHPYYANELMLKFDEARHIITNNPQIVKFTRPLYGSSECISGIPRVCIWITDDRLDEALEIDNIKDRVKAIEKTRRSKVKDKQALKLVDASHRFRDQHEAIHNLMVIPIVSSESRDYLPVDYFSADAIVHNKAFALYDAPLWNLALIASRLHWVWIGTVCVRMRTDFSYSNTLGWNTFPLPQFTTKNKADLTACAEEILLVRERHFPATIANLYAPDKMPADLKRAHDRNDEVLERIYIGRRFKNDTERLEKLFELYTEMTA
jgi:hypothetical protein